MSSILDRDFEIIKPIVLEKGKDVVGHASTIGQMEAEIERLRKRIKELEEERTTNDKRNKRNTSRTRNR